MSSLPPADVIAAALAAALPPEHAAAAPGLAELLASLAAGQKAPDAVTPALTAALQAIAGQQVAAHNYLLSFGSGAQFGDVAIGDVAGGNVVKLTIPITRGDTTEQTVSAGPGGTISQVWQLKIDGTGHTIVLGGGNTNAAADAPPPAAATLNDGATIFLADGGVGSAELEHLAGELRLRGMRVWREPELGDRSRRAYDAALITIDAAIVLLSPASCDADRLLYQELPAIAARFAQPAPFWVIPVISGVSERAAERALGASGVRLADLRAFALNGDEEARAAQLRDLARLTLRNVALPHLRQSVARDGAVELRLFTHLAAGATGRADLLLDWSALFGTREAPLWPDAAAWASMLLPALADVRQVIGASGAARLRIDGRFHLSAAYALGYQFPATTGVQVEVKSTTSDEWWGLNRSGEAGPLLIEEHPPIERPGGVEATVEISLTQDARADVTEQLNALPHAIGRRVQLSSEPVLRQQMARAFVASPAHALALAQQIADTILLQKRTVKIHLFGPLPQALAVLVGTRLNTARPVQCYEYVRDTAAYVEACLLR